MATNYADRIAKGEEFIQKKQALISKREASITKLNKSASPKLKKLGIEPARDDSYEEYMRMDADFDRLRTLHRNWEDDSVKHEVFNDLYWNEMYKLSGAFESIRDAHVAIAEKQKVLEGHREKLNRADEVQAQLDAMPEVIRTFMASVEKAWNEHDIRVRDEYKHVLYPKFREEYDARQNAMWNMPKGEEKDKAYKELQQFQRQFHEKHSYASGLSCMKDEQIYEANHQHAVNLVIDLYSRVRKITGDITDASGLCVTAGNQGYAVINGMVKGKLGKAEVESIECAGYNIVRWHIRTIVHDRS